MLAHRCILEAISALAAKQTGPASAALSTRPSTVASGSD
jgi:hypothetical protein